jgi:sugar phosphate isomerase/epimerase
MVSTRLVQPTDPAVAATFKAAAENGIGFVRIGGHKYEEAGDPVQQLAEILKDCQAFAALAREHNVVAGYHNHSGELNFGAPLWDLLRVIEQLNEPHFGSNFDIGHCMAEGPFGDWDITTRALAPHVKMVAVKDFKFVDAQPRWVELGKGIVQPAGFFERLRAAGFSGSVSIHFEYDAYEEADADGKIAQITAAVQYVRAELAKAGYTA